LVLDKSPNQVVEEPAWQIACLDRRAEGYEDRMSGELRRVIALVEEAIPLSEQPEGGVGTSDLVTKVIRDPAE